MRLSWGVDGYGFYIIVDDDRNPHEALTGKLTQFQAMVFIARLKRKHKRAPVSNWIRRKNDPITNSKALRLQVVKAG